MVGSGLLAEGSLKGLLMGTHFNRCKKLHVAAALSFKILHFAAFLNEYLGERDEENFYTNEIIDILKSDNSDPRNSDQTLLTLQNILLRYHDYTQETLNGKHGCTAKFAAMYTWFIELYQMFEFAIRTSDINLYIYSAYKMCTLFFAFNHQNYARWLTRNLDNLMNIENTHPDLLAEFQSGGLSIRRTTRNFCRSPIDLTLEQTINANAGNKLTGITSFTNSLCARQRWSETHYARTAIITHLLESLNLAKYDDNSSQYRSKIFNQQLQNFTQEVCNNINPFCRDINSSKLFNLTTGKSASEEVTEFLTNVESIGMDQMQAFIQECNVDGSRFDRPLKRNKVNNFSSETLRKKGPSHKPIDELKIQRNILGKVLCLVHQNEIDLQSVLSYYSTFVCSF